MSNTDSVLIADPRSLRDDINSSWQILQLESKSVHQALLDRYKDTEQRIGTATEAHSLQRLYSFKKFLHAIATALDSRDNFIRRIVANFNSLDDGYWAGIIHGQQLIAENQSLKAELESLSHRIHILEDGLKKALQRKQGDVGSEQVALQTNKKKAA